MSRKHKKKPLKLVKIANEHIADLFSLARKVGLKEPGLADRYVFLARKIAMKFKIKLLPVFKRQFCKHCYSYLILSKNCRVRIHDSKIIYYCNNCGKYTRIQLKTVKK